MKDLFKVRKWFIFLFLIVLVLLVAGCNNDTNTNSKNDPNDNSSEAFSESEEKSVDFPNDTLRINVGFDAGSSTDRVARPVIPYLEEVLGQSIIVENLPGASGLVMWTDYVEEPADGYTIALTNWPLLTTTQLDESASYSPEDFVMLAGNSSDPLAFLVSQDSEWETIEDFINDAKQNPGQYKVSMTGPASFHNIAAHVLMDEFDIEFEIVNAPGGASEAAQLLVNGSVDANLNNAFGGISIQDSAKALGFFSDQDVSELWPDVKPINEIMNSDMPNLTVMRGFSVHSEFKDNEPENFQILVNAFEEAMTHPDFVAEREEAGDNQVVHWISAEDAQARVKELNDIVEEYKEYILE